jgi:uncharacterized protein (DUF1684 family)
MIADVRKFQEDLNKEFSDPKTSPLQPEALKNFKTLPFYDINSSYRVTAKLHSQVGTDFKPMKTTTARFANNRVFGILEFTLDGKKIEIPVYQSKELIDVPEYKDYLFFPFKDLTNDEETYGGGRYIDLRIPAGDEIVIDFNKAYNPSCAYNPKYSCPIVPSENYIDLAIKAGVMYKGK